MFNNLYMIIIYNHFAINSYLYFETLPTTINFLTDTLTENNCSNSQPETGYNKCTQLSINNVHF